MAGVRGYALAIPAHGAIGESPCVLLRGERHTRLGIRDAPYPTEPHDSGRPQPTAAHPRVIHQAALPASNARPTTFKAKMGFTPSKIGNTWASIT